MPKYAVLSDIHSNWEALNTVLEKCRTLDPEMKFVCLGDIVGYNANPHECLELMRSLKCFGMVRGNHDQYVADEHGVEGFNPRAKAAVEWTKKQLTDEERAFLGKTPMRTCVPGTNMTLVHATLDSPDNWGYIFDLHHAICSFEYQFTQVCFCGHSHIPVAFEKRPNSDSEADKFAVIEDWTVSHVPEGTEDVFLHEDVSTVKLAPLHKYLFNVGSIGQPRNRDPRASFVVYDTGAMTVSRYRLPYDIAATQQKILAAGLPELVAESLANRLAKGT